MDMQLEEEEQLLQATNQSNYNSAGGYIATLATLQEREAQNNVSIWSKFATFSRVMLLSFTKSQHRFNNEIETSILQNEPSDCALTAKYSLVESLSLEGSNLSINDVSLSVLQIPHPLRMYKKKKTDTEASTFPFLNELDRLPVVVLVHGMGGQVSQFEPLIALLSQCADILSLDLPGFGTSRVTPPHNTIGLFGETAKEIRAAVGKMTYEDFKTDNIVEILSRLVRKHVPENRKVILIGHSMGTHLSVKLVNKLPPNKVESVILLSPPGVVDNTTGLSAPAKRPLFNKLVLFQYFPSLFNLFRVWDRIGGLESVSVARQIPLSASIYQKSRQFRWNLDVDLDIVLKYGSGFLPLKKSELVTACSKIIDYGQELSPPSFPRILIVCGDADRLTPFKASQTICDSLNALNFKAKVLKINNCGHSILLDKPERVCGLVLEFIETNLSDCHISPAWVLQCKAKISGDKWGLKNEIKWAKLKAVSNVLVNPRTNSRAPLLGMKTLRESDETHSPAQLEALHPDIIAVVDISKDVPSYNPESFTRVKYNKLPTVSKVPPDSVTVRNFINLADKNFSDYRAESGAIEHPLLAVHCHYGFNRTGFLICCYLIEKLGWSVNEAVMAFKLAKEPGIKHPHFIDALYVRYEQ
ncbi:hypothetical protein BABINDRAFT_162696 [Babjeviella inositovora NRRL Y-12698]|uniref:Tyrosine specific protein phosphatases domain-containing protein n=1 Tax=Babjeviella inositovora NRRL Y-12698 TaxID=984486 RepID=A0A1E3QNB9_9ASCO|nr:uncharacterized protein BABINDRAFT_162696 [Babjeviella inositovora NRRL Y-12698]ODQ78487.1 hypothetical protein BABINDRAFT_162696 [Babjeviella inositovora NRRL Y-12698]